MAKSKFPKGTKSKSVTNKYRSGFEAKVAEQLRKKKVKFKYESQKLKYTVPESKHTYIIDFELPNGIIIEAKGKFDSDARKKMKLVKEQFPDARIKMLFQRNQPIRKGSKTLYSDWCEKNGYEYAVGIVPDEWLK